MHGPKARAGKAPQAPAWKQYGNRTKRRSLSGKDYVHGTSQGQDSMLYFSDSKPSSLCMPRLIIRSALQPRRKSPRLYEPPHPPPRATRTLTSSLPILAGSIWYFSSRPCMAVMRTELISSLPRNERREKTIGPRVDRRGWVSLAGMACVFK